jgi:hypothetical protein
MTATNYHRYRITYFDQRMPDAPWQTATVQAVTAADACRVLTNIGLSIADILTLPDPNPTTYAD